MNTPENNKRIAKNTLLLYARMFFSILVGLYTSRVVLQALGVSDYGIYNVVGGVVTMTSFINAGLSAASQRFISFALGKGDLKNLNRVFSTSVTIHITIAIIIVIIAETLGLWFVNTQLNIATERMVAANWVYQFSIFTFFFSIINVPYNACIIAHEHMNAFAYISILEVMLKLIMAFLLMISGFDKLIIYGGYLLFVAFFIWVVYGIYCKRHFEECIYHIYFDKKLFREIFFFSLWSMFGNLGFVARDQGSNIIINIFCGTVVNGARGIGLQVMGIVAGFCNNFVMAINPQITKTYAKGDIDTNRKIVMSGCRISFFLLSIISIPVIINARYVLQLWLGQTPEFADMFIIYSLIAALLYSMSQPITIAIQATGKVMAFQLGVCIILFLELPMVWAILKMGLPPYMAMLPTILTNFISIFFRFYLIKRYIPSYSWKDYIVSVLARCLVIFIVCVTLSFLIKQNFTNTFPNLLLTSFISLLISCVIIYIVGLAKAERELVNNMLLSAIQKIDKWHKHSPQTNSNQK